MTADTKIKLLAILNHLLFIGGVVYSFSWTGLLYGFIIYLLIVTIGTSIGYHRYYTHKSFNTNKTWELIFLFFGSIAFLGPVIAWSGIHRIHHAKSDTNEDPHSPLNGFFNTWFHIFPNKNISPKYIADLIKDPWLKFQHKWYFCMVTIYLVLGYLAIGHWAVYIISMPAVLMYHVTGFINSVNHMIGEQKSKHDRSTNIPILSLVTGGESYHSNHHVRPGSSVFGKYDIAKIFLPWIIK